jgi:hypothetical protein
MFCSGFDLHEISTYFLMLNPLLTAGSFVATGPAIRWPPEACT